VPGNDSIRRRANKGKTDTGTIANSATFSDAEYTALLEVRDADDNVLSSCSASAETVVSGG